MSQQQRTLDLAILGHLAQGPSHGYEIRKHITSAPARIHRISFGSLYPALRRLTSKGLICDCGAGVARLVQGRSRRIYHLTDLGRSHLKTELHSVVPGIQDDDFAVRFALFELVDAATRVTILNLRKADLQAKLTAIKTNTNQVGDYEAQLLDHFETIYQKEIQWLEGLIVQEQQKITKEKR